MLTSYALRYALRRLRQSPVFAVVSVVTLALGMGANTAIFTLVNAAMLENLPVASPEQLYRLGSANNCCVLGGFQDSWAIYSYALYEQFRDHTPEFSHMAAFQGGLAPLSVRRRGATEPAQPYRGEFVSGNYFAMFGVGAFAGRTITPNDDKANAPPVVVMSYRSWQQQFGLDPSVIGATFTVNTMPYTVAGIAPPGFFGDTLRPDPPDFWLPLATEPALSGQNSLLHRGFHWLYIIGRLKSGASRTAVQSELTVELQQWLGVQSGLTDHDRSEIAKQHIVLAPGGGGVANLQNDYKTGLRLITMLSGLVLLIACANIANLLLARGAAMHSETAIRVALGAPRHALIRQVLTESVLLAILGGLAGLFVAFVGTRTILLLAFRGAHYVPISPMPSLAVLGFAFLLSLITGIVFGIAPAWITSHCDPADALRGAGRSVRDRSSLPRKSLVVLQVALSAILLIGAGLLSVTLRNLETQRFGFEPKGRLIVRVEPALAGYKPEKLYGLYQQLEPRLSQIPGVISSSYSIYSPMRGDNWSFGISIEGHVPDERIGASFDRVGPHYFETIGTRLLRGRAIGAEDSPTSRQVAVINETFAHKFFPNEDSLGKHFGFGDASHTNDFEIVGIVEDAKYQDAREPAYATFFLPFLQMTKDPKLSFMIGSHYIQDIELHVVGKAENLETAVRHALADIDPNLTVLELRTLSEQLDRNFNQDRLIARLTELFGLLALILASVGLYGVTAYSVTRRTGEIGIRMALGADRAKVICMVLRGALVQLCLGLAVGIPAALAGGRLTANQLYGVKSHDPLVLVLATAVLATCALLAGFIPARRAASIDPMEALRTE
ncbi:MAG: ABC transporter permease [Acidobacteria bacterium Pan2503]|uniref:ABC transporter permease n=1 Tax=Candidatus Acidiferrum panamense TaxID=2741543 RepID=A0A7V8NVB6_9BACT|nr:ABC transporter permease [Candidatus Acidoferrum panamensis]